MTGIGLHTVDITGQGAECSQMDLYPISSSGAFGPGELKSHGYYQNTLFVSQQLFNGQYKQNLYFLVGKSMLKTLF